MKRNKIIIALMAAFLGKKELAVDEATGTVTLSDEEKTKLIAQYGQPAVDLLTTPPAADEPEGDNASAIFDAAVRHAATQQFPAALAEATGELAAAKTQITSLQADIATLSALPEPLPAAEAVVAGGAKPVGFKANMALTHNRAAAAYLSSGVMAADPAKTIDVGNLQQELGNYLSQGNNIPILKQLYQSFSTGKVLNWKLAVTEYKAVMSDAVESVVQQFKPEWNPKGKGKFTAHVIKNRRHKVNYAIIPAEVGVSWLFHLYNESQTPSQMPLTRYIIENILLPKIAEDLEMKMVGKGKYVAESTKTEETMDGIETQLVAAKQSLDKGINFWKKNFNPLTATDDEVLEFVDEFVAAIAPLYRAQQMPVYMCGDVYLKYKRAYKKRWGAQSGTQDVQFGADRVDFSNCYLKVLDCLHGSPIVFSTPSQNLIGLRHINEPQFIQKIQEYEYEARVVGEFWFGVGFLIGEAVWANVPDGYDPSTAISSTRYGSTDLWLTSNEEADPDDGDGEGA